MIGFNSFHQKINSSKGT